MSPHHHPHQFPSIHLNHVSQKYGVVPQVIYPESYSSSASSALDHILTSKLREFSLELRAISTSLQQSSGLTKEQAKDKARRRKDEMMKDVYNVLAITLGTPPKPEEEFRWESYDKDGKYFKIEMTPKDFYKVSHTSAANIHLVSD